MRIRRFFGKQLFLWLLVLFHIVIVNYVSEKAEARLDEISRIYDTIRIDCRFIPNDGIASAFKMNWSVANRIMHNESVADYYGELITPFYWRDPGPSSVNATAYGTTDPYEFGIRHDLEINIAEDYSIWQGEDVALLGAYTLENIDCDIGDYMTITGSLSMDQKNEKGPEYKVKIIGTYEDPTMAFTLLDIIVPESSFYTDEKLITSETAKNSWRQYRDFTCSIDKGYSRKLEQVEEELNEIIGCDWILYTNRREIQHAVKPLEQSYEFLMLIQKFVNVLLYLLHICITWILIRSLDNDILVRRIYGARKWHIVLYWLLTFDIALLAGCIGICLLHRTAITGQILFRVYVVCTISAAVGLYTMIRTPILMLLQKRDKKLWMN